MAQVDTPPAAKKLTELARSASGLRLLVLFGSRARGDAHPGSDWDLGYLAEDGFDPDALMAQLVVTLGDDRVDIVDLARANGLLRYRVAGEGKPIYESAPHTFEDFWLEAVTFWCDVQPVLEAAYDGVLARLER